MKFRDTVRVPFVGRSTREVDSHLGPWSELVARFGPLVVTPLFRQPPATLAEIVALAAARDRQYRPVRFEHYFAVVSDRGADPARLCRALAEWDTVEHAYPEPTASEPPMVDPSDDPRRPRQGYLNPAPEGVDAEYAWQFAGGDGAGQAVVDLEKGWNLNHEDLPPGISLIGSNLNLTHKPHGTRTLGVIAARDNTLGGIGIVPNLASIRCISQWVTAQQEEVASPIMDAAVAMNAGDVLLLEAQIDVLGLEDLPVEMDQAVFDVIANATSRGIVVVEAAGNGGHDLDTVADAYGTHIFDRNVRDSGAIVVGGCWPHDGRTRLDDSCFGSRVDCYAWGQGVSTTNTDEAATDNARYTDYFSGTSSASAIVAGVALAVQGLAEAHVGTRLDPVSLRALVSDPALGTPSANPGADRIGVMPDLRAIVGPGGLNIAPDVYLRDFVGDTGGPHSEMVSASPDIVLRQQPIPNPSVALGEGSGTENDDALSQEARAGKDNYLYVRVRNRGGTTATGVTVTVYWAPPSTLLSPDLWTVVGSTQVASVAPGNVFSVSDAMVWPAAAVPASGHYCFVAVLSHALDPAPATAKFAIWDEFLDHVRSHGNVAWRNFNVVDYAPLPADAANGMALDFAMSGAPDRARRMCLAVVGRLPSGARASLEMPAPWAGAMRSLARTGRPAAAGRVTRLLVNPRGTTKFAAVLLPMGERIPMRLFVWIPKPHRRHAFEIEARQFEGDGEVGRVTWRLIPRVTRGRPRRAAGRR